MQNRKKRYLCIAAGIVLVLCLAILIGKVIKPAYDRYIASDYAKTCEKARFVIIDRYQQIIEQGGESSQIDDDQVLNQVLQSMQEDFPQMVVEDGNILHLCRSGGVYTIHMEKDSHQMEITCSVHGEYGSAGSAQ